MTSRVVPPLLALVLGVACASCTCGGGGGGGAASTHRLIVADRFTQAGATGSGGEAVEGLHPYVVDGVATLDVRTRDWFVDIASLSASSSDDAVLTVREQAVEDIEPFTLFSEKELRVVVHAVAEGSADVVFTDRGGNVVDTRTLRVVVPDGVAVQFPITVPGLPDPALDVNDLRVGVLGADLLLAFTAGGEVAHGLAVFGVTGTAGGHAQLHTAPLGFQLGGGIAPERDVLHLDGNIGSHAVDLTYRGEALASLSVSSALDVDVASADFIVRQTLAEYLFDHAGIEVPGEIARALASNDDKKLVCGDDDRCVARINTATADGVTIVGADVTWNLPADAAANNGDIVSFERSFGASTDLSATANGMTSNVTVGGASDSVAVFRSTSAHCAQAGADTCALVSLVALAFGARRRRRRNRR